MQLNIAFVSRPRNNLTLLLWLFHAYGIFHRKYRLPLNTGEHLSQNNLYQFQEKNNPKRRHLILFKLESALSLYKSYFIERVFTI